MRVDGMTDEIEMLHERVAMLEGELSKKDAEIRELESAADDMRLLAEQQQFDIFYSVRQEVAKELEVRQQASYQELKDAGDSKEVEQITE